MTVARSIIVRGGILSPGSVRVSGYKHALVPVIAACVARRGRIRLRNVPAIRETEVFGELLLTLGARVERVGEDMRIDCAGLAMCEVDPKLSAEIHGSVYLIPALIAANGCVRFVRAGGCRIGDISADRDRPVHHMINVLERFGTVFKISNEWIVGNSNGLNAIELDVMDYSARRDLLTGPLVSGATKTALIAALGANGITRVSNPYLKPDVTELVTSVARAGSVVTVSDSHIDLSTRPYWPSDSWTEHALISDISEIMTYITLAVSTGVTLTIEGITVDRVLSGLAAEIKLLAAMDIQLRWEQDRLQVVPPDQVRSTDIEVTSVGIYSDHQPFFALMLLKGDRPARIHEHVWQDRFDYAGELIKLGANIHFGTGEIVVSPSRLHNGGAHVIARDLRGAAALVIAAITRGGETRIDGTEHLDRGYSRFLDDLQRLGIETEEI